MESSYNRNAVLHKKPPVSALGRSLETAVVIVKVGIVTVAWLAVFLMTFLGYLTLPAIVLFVFLVLYSLLDFIGQLRRRKLPQ